MATANNENFSPLKEKIHEIIFEADTPAGKIFDVILLIAIVVSVIAVMLESVQDINARYSDFLYVLEWVLTVFFTIEYILRLYCVYRPIKYTTSFFGIIDLLSILPAYLSLFFAGTHYLMVIRALRLLRIFRIFKLTKFLKESSLILSALKSSRNKIAVFLVFILLCVTVIGSIMYLVEGASNTDFTSIPRSIYWAIVTITTVGYGDIAPKTELGQFLAAIVMIMGYAVIAVPTGIVSAEIAKESRAEQERKDELISTQICRYCAMEGHDSDAGFCKFCGEPLHE
ncbi:MAG: voltage-gated potassium channel [Polaribacter sp.]|jgi:voltage-gated potassium channel